MAKAAKCLLYFHDTSASVSRTALEGLCTEHGDLDWTVSFIGCAPESDTIFNENSVVIESFMVEQEIPFFSQLGEVTCSRNKSDFHIFP